MRCRGAASSEGAAAARLRGDRGDRRRAGRVAAPARRFSNVVDLTHTMSPEFPTFFGVPGIEMEKKFDFKKDGFNLYWWRIIEHAGTHLDAPIHFSEAGMTADKIPAATLVVSAGGDRRLRQGGAESRLSGDAARTSCMGAQEPPASRQLLRRHAFRLGQHVGRRREVHRQGCRRGHSLSRLLPGCGAWLMKERKVAGHCGRYALARLRSVEGLQGALHLAAVRAMGPRERRQSRPGAGWPAPRWWSAFQGEGRDRRSRPPVRAGVGEAAGGADVGMGGSGLRACNARNPRYPSSSLRFLDASVAVHR